MLVAHQNTTRRHNPEHFEVKSPTLLRKKLGQKNDLFRPHDFIRLVLSLLLIQV